ncbi:cysteine hydrolase family protein [Cohnella sp. WQ 127256]|uniref:cysteine hydrolase family protein n=1 Tax=Cohnella sp. WQ 127256 TaxID=2938790 RepID=UPI00211936B8|nr:isochorismatase family cysteine hydrolase [Cohnella sp. WQ 127256]
MATHPQLPDNYVLNSSETALLVIDMQNGFCSLQGSLGLNGVDVSHMKATIEPVKKLIKSSRKAGILDAWTIQEHYPDDVTRKNHRIIPHTLRFGSGPAALAHTWDSEVVDELKPLYIHPAEEIRKHRFSAFFDTRLDTLLRMKGIKTLIISGVSTSLCVETTIRDAYQRDYDVIIAEDAIATDSVEAHEWSMRIAAKYFGACMKTDEIVGLIEESMSVAIHE